MSWWTKWFSSWVRQTPSLSPYLLYSLSFLSPSLVRCIVVLYFISQILGFLLVCVLIMLIGSLIWEQVTGEVSVTSNLPPSISLLIPLFDDIVLVLFCFFQGFSVYVPYYGLFTDGVTNSFLQIISNIIVLNTFVPISLYVTWGSDTFSRRSFPQSLLAFVSSALALLVWRWFVWVCPCSSILMLTCTMSRTTFRQWQSELYKTCEVWSQSICDFPVCYIYTTWVYAIHFIASNRYYL